MRESVDTRAGVAREILGNALPYVNGDSRPGFALVMRETVAAGFDPPITFSTAVGLLVAS